MKRLLISIFFLFGLIQSKEAVSVKVNQPGQLVIEISIDSVWVSEIDQTIKTIPHLDPYLRPGYPIVPFFQDLFVGLPANADVRVFSDEKTLIGQYDPILSEAEFVKGADIQIPVEYKFDGHFPKQSVMVSKTKDISDVPTSKIEIFPFTIQGGKLFVNRNFSVQITWNPQGVYPSAKRLSNNTLKELDITKKLQKPTENVIPEYQFSQNIAKIVVDTSAWYKISGSELKANNIDLSNVDPNTIRIWNKEDEVTLLVESGDDGVFDDDDMIIFYGEKNPPPEWADYDNNFYTDDNVYWLTWGSGNGKRFSELDVSPDLPESDVYKPEYFTYEKKIERDDRGQRVNGIDRYELQTWDVVDQIFMLPRILARLPEPGKNWFDFEIEHPVLGGAKIDLELLVKGVGNNKTKPYDLATILNEESIFRNSWTGLEFQTIIINNVPNSLIKQGSNSLSFILSPDDLGAHEEITLNWFKIKYPKYYNASEDYLWFNVDTVIEKTCEIEVNNFDNENIILFKNRQATLTNFQQAENSQNSGKSIKFQDINNKIDAYFEAVSFSALQGVKSINIEEPVTELLNQIRNSYIFIAPDSFFSTLQPLAEYHNAAIVEVEDIYRQYSHGIYSPYGIKKFLQEVYNESNGNLKYVVMSMISNYVLFETGLGLIGESPSIPTMYVVTHDVGPITSDHWYTVFEEDYWNPAFIISRFPANNIIELETIVNKTLGYYNRSVELWNNNHFLIGGSSPIFRIQSEGLAGDFIDNGVFLSRLYNSPTIPDSIFYGRASDLRARIDSGFAFINFFGHGGGGIWADNRLLHRDQVELLKNGYKTPFVSSLTCWTGDYASKYSISRSMLTHSEGGAIGWFGASGLAYSSNDYYIGKILSSTLFSETDLTIGELITLTKLKYFLSYSDISPEVASTYMYEYNLIGDPAIKLKRPQKESVELTPLDPEPGEILNLSFNNSNVDSVHYQTFLPDKKSLNSASFIEDLAVAVPDTFGKGVHAINIAYKSGDDWYKSANTFTVSGSYANIQATVPANPTVCDSIGVIAEVSDRNGIASVQLFMNNNFWADMVSDDGAIYRINRLIPPQSSGNTLKLACQVIDANNDTTLSSPKIVSIGEIPNIAPLNGQFVIDDNINLAIEVESTTDSPVKVNTNLYIDRNGQWELIGENIIDFINSEKKVSNFPGYFPYGLNKYKVVTSTDFTCVSIDDSLTFELETNAFWVTPELGSTEDGVNHTKIGIKNIEIDIQAGVVTKPSILQINPLTEIAIQAQPNFEVKNTASDYLGIGIDWDSDANFNINWIVGNAVVQSSEILYQYFEDYRSWLPINYSISNDKTILFTAEGSTKFAFLKNDDIVKPKITATINGQTYLKNIYIGKEPIIQFSVYDENGIDFRADSIEYWINNDRMNNLNPTLGGSGNNIEIALNPSLTEIDSSLAILARDAAGNLSDTLNINFNVSEKLDLLDYGNFPNPFSESTLFAYELTDQVDKLTFTIYTVEGRKIRNLELTDVVSGSELHIPGYHEIQWDGKNYDGVNAANGNYFYQIRVKNGKSTIEKTGKILKIQ